MRIPDLTDIPEPKLAEPGEYDLRIISAKDKVTAGNEAENKPKRNYLFLVCEFKGEDNIENLVHSIYLPCEEDDERKQNIMWRMLKEFIVGIGLDPAGCETSDFEGVEFSAIIGLEKDLQGQPRNVIKRIT